MLRCSKALVLSFMMMVMGGVAWGQEPANPDALELFKKMAAFYTATADFTASMTLTMQGTEPDQPPRTMINRFQMSLDRPKRFRVSAEGEAVNMLGVGDGETITLLDVKRNEYTQDDPPEEPAMVLGLSGTGMMRIGTMLMAEPFRVKPYDSLVEGVEKGEYVGAEKINDIACHHIKLIHPELDWEMWIDSGENPLVHKVTIDTQKVLNNAKATSMKIDITIEYAGWEINPAWPDDRFAFVPPKDAKNMEPSDSTEDGGPDALQGKPAPDFTADLLDGNKMTLSQHKDKAIVILDFWATWCGPCQRALPIYAKIAEDYKANGVVFYAVNLQEKPEKVKDYVKNSMLSCPFALDVQGSIADKYRIKSIPTSFIIGKDGIVKEVHIGLAPTLDEDIRKSLNAMLGTAPAK